MESQGAMVGPYEKYAEIYDQVGGDQFSLKMLRLLEGFLRKYDCQPRAALDLACGTGSVALALARKGIAATGLDLSEAMLTQAKAKSCHEPGLPIRFLHGDMRSFHLSETVQLATCFFDAMNYNLRDEDLLAAFKCTAACLELNGLFVFDMNSVYALSTVWGNKAFTEDHGDVVYIWQNEYEPVTRTGTLTATFFVKHDELYERFTEVHVERGYYIVEVIDLLGQAGFEILEVARTDGLPAQETDVRHVYVARRT